MFYINGYELISYFGNEKKNRQHHGTEQFILGRNQVSQSENGVSPNEGKLKSNISMGNEAWRINEEIMKPNKITKEGTIHKNTIDLK